MLIYIMKMVKHLYITQLKMVYNNLIKNFVIFFIGNMEIILILIKNWAFLTHKSKSGTPIELANQLKKDNISKFLNEIIKQESQSILPSNLWLHIFNFVSFNGDSLKSIPLVCKQWRRIRYLKKFITYLNLFKWNVENFKNKRTKRRKNK